MNKLNNDILKKCKEINYILKSLPLVVEYNKLYDFLLNDPKFNEDRNTLLANKKTLKTRINYLENRKIFFENKQKLENNVVYQNYLSVKEELNNLINEINNLLSIK